MRLGDQMRLAVGLLAALQIATAAAGAWLLLRTGPAIERILAENDYSLAAAEEMRAVVAARPVGAAGRDRFATALERARSNITEEAEPAMLTAIESHAPGALRGDPADRAALLETLDGLAALNRASMHRADARAQRLARAGAWALSGLALLNLGLGLLIVRRTRDRLLAPLDRVHRVARALHRDDRRQRCGGGPGELGAIGRALDDLLDELEQVHPPPLALDGDRAALLALLERMPHPAGIVLADGTLRAANRAGMAARSALKKAGRRTDLGEGRALLEMVEEEVRGEPQPAPDQPG